ncbi:MAG: autotransporter domain-containing protein, partial [Verrucomicrobiia bacterium]
VWNNSSVLYVGALGASNSLTIADGGQVFNTYGVVGNNAISSNNSVWVTGPGSLWSNSGDLIVGNAGSFNSLTISNGGHVVNANGYIGNSATANTNIVTVTGTNSLWLNTGSLSVGAMGVSNQLIVGSGATVEVLGSFKLGSNSLFLNSGSLISAAVEIDNGGELQVTSGGSLGTGAITNNGTLAFNPSGTITVTNVISGTGSLIEGGPGTLVLLSSNSFSGGTTITNGTLSLKNSFALGSGPVILNGGVLKADPLVMNFATYTQGGGTLQMAIGGTTLAGTDYDQVNVTGVATITGGTLKVVPFGTYQPKKGDAVPLLVAAGGLVGTYPVFDDSAFHLGATPVSALLQTNLIYSPTTLTLQWSQLPFGPYALTPNQQEVARNLDTVLNDPRMKAVVDYLDYLPGGVGQLPYAFDLISPQQLAPMFTMGFANADVQGYNLQNRLSQLRGGSTGFSAGGLSLFDPNGTLDGLNALPQFAANLPAQDLLAMSQGTLYSGALRPTADNPWGVFVDGAGQFIGVKGNENAGGYHVTTAGLTVGADYRVMDNTTYPFDQLVVGGSMGYANSSSDLAGDGRITVNGAQANAYAVWFREGLHVEGMVGGGCNVYDTRREALGGTASGNTDGWMLSGLLGTGYDWKQGPWRFGPEAFVQYTRLSMDSFDESGSLAPLHIESQSMDSLHTQIGAHCVYLMKVDTIELAPEVRLGWRHEYMNPDMSLDSRFANGAGSVFTTQGPVLGSDSAVVGAGLSVQWTRELGTYVNFDTELGPSNYQLFYVSAGVRVRF